jgi:DNA-binding NtrC family response regulator
MITRVVLAIRKPSLQGRVRRLLARSDVIVDAVKGRNELLECVRRENYDLAIISQLVLGKAEDDTINSLRRLPDAPEVIVLSDREDAEERARLLAVGCFSVLHTGLSNQALQDALRAILARRRERVEEGLVPRQVSSKPQLGDFISASQAMQTFLGVVRRVVASDTSLLITGETGVGKEHLARAIHAESLRGAGSFVAVNCGALPDALLESELFGHEEGAFTGASRARRGWFELAHRGTIFLDEIGDMPPHLQVKLLHVLQSREMRRVGGERAITIDVRVMAATNRDLEAEMEAGNFRRDLYFRLSVVNLSIPPLRERREDIPALVENYIAHFRTQIQRDVHGIEEKALDSLCRYDWPGNVRELINVIERAMLLCDAEEIRLVDLPESISGLRSALAESASAAAAFGPWETLPEELLDQSLRDVRAKVVADLERAYLKGVLAATGGRIGQTARRAGIEPRSVYEKMKVYGLRKEDFKPRRPRTSEQAQG